MAKLENVKTLDMVNGEIKKVEYGGEVYVKVIDEVALNDIVLSRGVKDARSGNFYVVNERDRYDDISIIDDEEEKRSQLQQFDVFRKQSAPSLNERVSVLESKVATIEKKSVAVDGGRIYTETITHNGAEYKLVDREAQAGDVVYVTKDAEGTTDIPNDTFYTVDKDGEIGDRWRHEVYKPRYNRTLDTVKVYEPVAKEEALKVGDYVKVIAAGTHEFPIGEIVKLVSDGNMPNFKAEYLNGGDYWFVDDVHIVRATDEEVAEAKAQAERQAKWASIGRKPGEFKKGDIVHSGNEYAEFTVLADEEIEDDVVHFESRTVALSKVGLVVPVEGRFDDISE